MTPATTFKADVAGGLDRIGVSAPRELAACTRFALCIVAWLYPDWPSLRAHGAKAIKLPWVDLAALAQLTCLRRRHHSNAVAPHAAHGWGLACFMTVGR